MGKQSRERKAKIQQVLLAREKADLIKRARFYDLVRQNVYDAEFPPVVIDASNMIDGMYYHWGKPYPDWKFGKPPSEWGLMSVKPPFNETFIEISPRDQFTIPCDECALDAFAVGVAVSDFETGRVGFSPTSLTWEGDLWGHGMCVLQLDDDGQIIGWEGELVDEGDTDAKARLRALVYGALYVLQFLNARNIVTVECEPDPIDSAAHERLFGLPMVKYHTLAVRSTLKRSDADPSPQKNFDVMPLHIRRGHLATYTEDAPLFGKYTGTFWRPATAVGNAKNGVVVKDYKPVP